MKKLIIILFFLALVSCKSTKPIIKEVPIHYKERVVTRLVSVPQPADSSAMLALFECDSDKQVILKKLDEEKSKRMQTNFSFSNGQFSYKTKTMHDTVFVKADSVTVYKEVPLRVEIPVTTNILTKWQRTQINLFRLILTLLTSAIVFKLWGSRFLNIIKTIFKL